MMGWDGMGMMGMGWVGDGVGWDQWWDAIIY